MGLPQIAVESVGVAALSFPVAMLTASFSLFLDYVLDHHPIGRWYLSQIQKLPENIAKPIGECVFCTGAWIFILSAFFIFNLPAWVCFLGVGANHLLLLFLTNWSQKVYQRLKK